MVVVCRHQTPHFFIFFKTRTPPYTHVAVCCPRKQEDVTSRDCRLVRGATGSQPQSDLEAPWRARGNGNSLYTYPHRLHDPTPRLPGLSVETIASARGDAEDLCPPRLHRASVFRRGRQQQEAGIQLPACQGWNNERQKQEVLATSLHQDAFIRCGRWHQEGRILLLLTAR